MGLIKEFKDFAMRGNVVDMAVGIIIGAAFGKIVSSLVKDVVMPPIGKLIGGVNFSELKFSVGTTIEKIEKDGETVEVAKDIFVNYGVFLQTVFDFLIVAIAVFLLVKLVNRASEAMKQKEEEKAPTTKECPFCCVDIPIKAVRCPQCTAELPKIEK